MAASETNPRLLKHDDERMIPTEAGVIRYVPYHPLSNTRRNTFRGPEWGQLHPSDIWHHLSHLEDQYPDFRNWYFNKVIPDVLQGNRYVLACVAGENLLGITIAKRGYEPKLCTLWVAPGARAVGIAETLAHRAFDWIGTNRPLFTVPEEQLSFFRGLLRQWNFHPTQKITSYYREGKIEHVFNGYLVTQSLLQSTDEPSLRIR